MGCCESKTRERSVSEYHFPEREKITREISANQKLKITERKCPIPKIQNGVPKRSKEASEEKRLHGENRFKRYIFHSSTQSGIREICEVSMERESVRVHLSHVRAVTEDSNNNSKEVGLNIRLIIYIDDMGVFDVRMSEILMSRDTMLFLLEALGFVITYENSVLTPSTVMEFLGILINRQTMILAMPHEKMIKLLDFCRKTLDSKYITVRELA